MLEIGNKVERNKDGKIGIIKYTDFNCNSEFNYQVYYDDEVRWEKFSDIVKKSID